jgi:hypothetical protein
MVVSTKESVRKYVEENYDIYLELYVFDIDRFIDGTLVKIYLHSYNRMTTFDKNSDIFLVKEEEIGKNFIEKKEWRNKQLEKIKII